MAVGVGQRGWSTGGPGLNDLRGWWRPRVTGEAWWGSAAGWRWAWVSGVDQRGALPSMISGVGLVGRGDEAGGACGGGE